MPPGRRKIPTTLVSPARVVSRAVKRARPRPPLPTVQEEVILAAAAEKQQSPAEPIYMDSEDEFMDLGLETEFPSNSSSENLPLSPTPAPVSVTAALSHSQKKPLRRDSTQGLSSSIHASTEDNVATEKQPSSTLPRSSARTTARTIEHPSAAMTNNIAASLLAWQSAGAQHLRGLPPTIAADLKAIVTRSAARVIAGLPVFEQSQTAPNIKVGAQPAPQPEPPASSTYANAAKKNLSVPAHLPKATPRVTSPKKKNRPDSRVMIRLAPDHPLRFQDSLLVRTKLRSFLEKPELIKDIRSVPSGLAPVAPSSDQAPELMQAALALQPPQELCRSKDRKNEKISSSAQFPNMEELAAAKIDTKSIFSISWTRNSLASPEWEGTLRLVVAKPAADELLSSARLFARSAKIRPADNRPRLQVCQRCHGYHNINACTRRARCGLCASDSHKGPCTTPIKCLTCAGPHVASSTGCPARPFRANGVFVRPDKERMRVMRQEGHKSWLALNPPPPAPEPPAGSPSTQPSSTTIPTSILTIGSASRFAPLISLEESL
ncbi:putative effector protein [Blumeria hordei DH14]|uniref:Putative effector protein n=1 Tax=Blumeria graminis f. sp. hordei (strain DH14) TaxID=546991 RepID=N1J941_BLUG1|nr:putative effector protein [Blumeria hordei DH14]